MLKDVLKHLTQPAQDDLKLLLASRPKDTHEELAHFYLMGFQQCEIERIQKVIRTYNSRRKSRNERTG